MHPATTLNLLPLCVAMASAGIHVICGASRYARNDSALIMEKAVVDMGAYVRYAKEELDYDKVVLAGWSGGGSLSIFYQAEAEEPRTTVTPAGDPTGLSEANLIPADAIMSIAAHLSRAETLCEWMDPSVIDELDPAHRDTELDLYDPLNPNQPPYNEDYLARFRNAQIERNRRITSWAKASLAELESSADRERCFLVHRTMADPRWLDPNVDPNDRVPGICFLGDPATVNSGPVGLARFSSLRSWLSQWSLDESNATTAINAGRVTVPGIVIENSADDATPASHPRTINKLLGSRDKEMHVINGATHYYRGQPEQQTEVVNLCTDWMRRKNLLSN